MKLDELKPAQKVETRRRVGISKNWKKKRNFCARLYRTSQIASGCFPISQRGISRETENFRLSRL